MSSNGAAKYGLFGGLTANFVRLLRPLGGLVLMLFSVGLVLAVFEFSLRVVHRGAVPIESANPAAVLYRLSSNEALVFEHTPGVSVEFPGVENRYGTLMPWKVSIDASGRRVNGEPHSADPDLRGICLGDSIMFGAGLNDHETIAARLSERVSERLGRRFECANFGVANYTTAQEVEQFRFMRALDLDPSVVVLEIYTNDFKTRPGRVAGMGGRVELVAPDASRWASGWLSNLRLWNLGAKGVTQIRDILRSLGLYPQANGKPLKPEQIHAVTDALDDLRALLSRSSIPLVIAFFPRDWQLSARERTAATERQQVIENYCREHAIPYVDLLDEFFGKPTDSYFRPGDDSHPHARAVRTIADLIAGPIVEALQSKIKTPPPS